MPKCEITLNHVVAVPLRRVPKTRVLESMVDQGFVPVLSTPGRWQHEDCGVTFILKVVPNDGFQFLAFVKRNDYVLKLGFLPDSANIPDVRAIALILRRFSEKVDIQAKESEVLESLPILNHGHCWSVDRNVQITDSGNISVVWDVAIRDATKGLYLANRQFRCSRPLSFVVQKIQASDLVQEMEAKVLEYAHRKELENFLESFEPVREQANVTNVEFCELGAQVTLQVHPDDRDRLVEFLKTLRSEG